jgi:hypothetical protein
MDTTTLSIAMRIELHRAKFADIYNAENDDQEQEQDDVAQYEEELNAELDKEAAQSLNN